jgi:CubicO group peptidase (beta-lactamase class C family)
MRLHDQGKLDVDGRVQDYLPDFVLADGHAARELKIWHLLTHTPGFEGQLDTPDRGSETSAHFIETLRDLPQLAMPGQVWSYNNAGWGVAGRVVRTEITALSAAASIVCIT